MSVHKNGDRFFNAGFLEILIGVTGILSFYPFFCNFILCILYPLQTKRSQESYQK